MAYFYNKLNRKHGNKSPRKIYAIFCEWESEISYFKYLGRKYGKNVKTFKLQHKDFGWIANDIISKKKHLELNDNDSVFCVIDKDDHSISDYKEWSEEIEKNAKIIFSSKSFEVWLLMHFSRFEKSVYKVDEYRSLINRNEEYFKSKWINWEVRKPYSNDIWNALSDKTKDAINNAKHVSEKQINESEHNDKFECEPYTDIWDLVNELIN